MNETEKMRKACWLLIVSGWIVALAFSALLIALRAPRVQTMDPIMPYLITAVWLASLALVSVGTFRVTQFLKNMVLRVVVTLIAVLAQCFGYYLLLIVPAIYIHLWAGGNL